MKTNGTNEEKKNDVTLEDTFDWFDCSLSFVKETSFNENLKHGNYYSSNIDRTPST